MHGGIRSMAVAMSAMVNHRIASRDYLGGNDWLHFVEASQGALPDSEGLLGIPHWQATVSGSCRQRGATLCSPKTFWTKFPDVFPG